MANLKFEKALGANTDYQTCQVFVFPKSIPEDNQFMIASVISCQGEDVFTKIRLLAHSIEEAALSNEEPPSQKLPQLLSSLKDQVKEGEDLEILLASIKGNVLYLYAEGNHQAYLFRKDKLIDLIQGRKTQIISGYLKAGDKVLLLSSKQPQDDITPSTPWDDKIVETLLKIPLAQTEEESEALLTPAQTPFALALIEIPEEELINLKDVAPIISEPEAPEEPAALIKKPSLNLPHFSFNLKSLVPKSKKARMFLPAVLIIAIALIFALFRFGSNLTQKNTQISIFVSASKQNLSEALSLKDSDPTAAQQKLEQAKSQFTQAQNIDPKNPSVTSLKEELSKSTNDILKVYNLTDFPVFLSLDLIKQGFKTDKLIFSLDKFLLLDTSQKSLVSIDIKSKNNQILAGQSQLGDANIASLNGTDAFVYSKDKGVLRVDLDTQKVSVISKPDPEWGSITDIYGFGGNAYLLDSLKNQIWKYIPTKSGFSNKNTYLKASQNPDFSGSKKLQIDYSVWVLKSGPEILKFTGGASDFFSVAGMDQPLNELASISIPEEGDNLYVLDSQNSRIVVLKKNGQYVAQYTGDKFKTAEDLVVDTESKKIYLIEGNKIYQIDLKT